MRLRFFLLSAVLMLQCVVGPAEASSPTESIGSLLKKLKSECDNPQTSNESEWTSFGSATENKRLRYIAALKSLGRPAESQVRQKLATAKGEYQQMLVVTLAGFGDNTFIWQAGQLMLKAKPPAVRVCAANALRLRKDKRMMKSFKQALADPFLRRDGACIEPRLIYPVRLIASSALLELGLSQDEVRRIGLWWVLKTEK